mgnify:CR=1 FL=1
MFLLVGGVAYLLPLFVLVSNLGMVNSYPGLIFPFLAGPFGVFLMRQFIQSLPDELIHAARVDGALATSFTQKDINDFRVIYSHNNTQTASDSFLFSVTDGTTTLPNNTFNITVTGVTGAPVVTTNTGSTVAQGGIDVISSTELRTTDSNTLPAQLTYTVTSSSMDEEALSWFVDKRYNQIDGSINLMVLGMECSSGASELRAMFSEPAGFDDHVRQPRAALEPAQCPREHRFAAEQARGAVRLGRQGSGPCGL